MSREPSADRNVNGKRPLEQGADAAAELHYVAELRAKLQRDLEAQERERWGTPPPWFLEEERRKAAMVVPPRSPMLVGRAVGVPRRLARLLVLLRLALVLTTTRRASPTPTPSPPPPLLYSHPT